MTQDKESIAPRTEAWIRNADREATGDFFTTTEATDDFFDFIGGHANLDLTIV
jgi:hypothetical protein